MTEPPQKRFRYATYNEKLNEISVDVGKTKGLAWEKEEFADDEQSKTPFTVEIGRLELQDLTLPYQELARKLYPLTRTLPLTLLNLPTIIDIFTAFFGQLKGGSDNQHSGLDSALFLLQALFETCLGETTQHVPVIVKHLVRVGALRALEPKLVGRTYSTLSLVLRTMAPWLLKQENVAVLRNSWDEVRPYLRPHDNKPYVRKCIADAWAGVLRKARGDSLTRLMAVLLEEHTEGMEAVWANAMKGASKHLHSRALPIFNVLLDDLESNPVADQVVTVRHVATALVHHSSPSKTETGPLVEAVLRRVALTNSKKPSSSKAKAKANFGSSTAMLEVLGSFLMTRKGNCFPTAQLKPTMLKLQSLVPEVKESAANGGFSQDDVQLRNTWRKSVVTAIVGSLNAGHLSDWLSPGVALIDSLWAALPTREAFAFVNMCIAFKWSGVEQFLLAHISRAALAGLSEDPLPTLVLLNSLASNGFLAGGLANVQGGRWRPALVTALAKLLKSLTESELEINDRRVLGQVLRMLPHLAGEGQRFSESLIHLLQFFLKETSSTSESARDDYVEAGAWNNSHVVGRILASVYQLVIRGSGAVQDEFKNFFSESSVLNDLIRVWYWNREVLEQTANIIDQWPEVVEVEQENIELIQPNLISADSSLRMSTLKLLAIHAKSASEPVSQVWDLCLGVESAEMSLKNVRDRTTKIARLSRHLSNISVDDEASKNVINLAITYLVSQLKVNFRPVWGETVTALTSLAESHADEIWGIVWAEVDKTIQTSDAVMPDLGVENPEWTTQRVFEDIEEDAEGEDLEFRCTGLARGRQAAARAWIQSDDSTKLDVAEIRFQISSDRLDVMNYESQLMAVLTATPSMAEKHTRVVVPVLLAVAGEKDTEANVESAHLSTRKLQERTISWLELFAKFVNPKAAYLSPQLHALYLELLSKGEPKVQGVALRCLLTYKSPNLTPYRERLSNLLEESKFRDELAHLDLSTDSEVIEPTHRPEFLDVTIRLLYGIMMSRRARSSTAQGQGARKQAVLSALSGVSSQELKTLIDLMLEPFGGYDAIDTDELATAVISAPGRQQLGFLTFLQDLLRYLAIQTTEYWPRLIGATIVLIRQAQEGIDQEKTAEKEDEEEDAEEDDEDKEEKEDKGAVPLRTVRSTGIKRLVQFLRSSAVDYDYKPFLEIIFSAVISPRLPRLELENTQAPSGTLDLIAALAVSPDTATSLVQYDDRTLPKVYACMTAVKVKPAVIGRVFDVVESLLVEDETEIVENVLLPHITPLIDNIIGLVQNLKAHGNDELMRRLLGILSRLSVVVTDGQQAQQLATLLGPMLRQAGRQVPEKAKVNILLTLQRLYSISPDFKDSSSAFFGQSYDMISNLFQTLHMSTSRRALVGALETFAVADPSLAPTISLVADLNSYRVKRMDEPDFDRRLEAFGQLNEGPLDTLPKTAREWLPILRSALHFIQDPEELSIRTSSGSVLKRFASRVGDAEEGPLVYQLQFSVLPALRRILLSKAELVRTEVLSVLSRMVRTCTGVPVLAEMTPLLGEDDETDIFINVSHIQVHRRARALRRLRDICSEGGIRETTLSTIWMPVLEHILTGSTDIKDHTIVNEAITTIGALAGQFGWSRYNGLIMRFLRLGSPKAPQQKFYIRGVSAIIDNFHFDLRGDATVGEAEEEDVDEPVVEEAEATEATTEAPANGEAEDIVEVPAAVVPSPTERITEVVLHRLLPTLNNFVSDRKSETEETVRIPVAVAIVKLAHALPEDQAGNEILRIVTTASQILRSKDQDTRDIARETMCKIAIYLGPEWLVRVLKELRSALQRGPQKHVLAVTTHSILVQATADTTGRFNNLDTAVQDAVEVSAEVIWGESGKDVATEGFKTKMREVRGALSRGNDTFQLVSRLVSPSKIGAILTPVREIMTVSQAVKTMQQVDEVLRRIALGLNANELIGPEDILSLSHSLINGNSQYLRVTKRKTPKEGKTDRFTVQMKRNVNKDEDVYPQNAYKFVTFGLELFVTAFRRGKFDFDDVNMLARLGPLVSAIGNTLYSPKSEILILGLKATAAVARCPVPQVDDALPTFVTNIFKIIKNAGGTAESEVAQTALKTLAVLIRDCKATEVTDSQLKYLIEVVSPDLEDHERQSCLFTVLRAVVARRFVVPEIYDLMDRVSSIMVTSQSSHVQELCRGVLMQFLLDYPQGQGRLKAQMTFLALNLGYDFESGRVSVMEVLSAVFNKFSSELLADYADMFFTALVTVIANDDSEKCRNMAGALLQQLFAAIDHENQQRLLQVLKSWIEARDKDQAVAGTALAAYGLLCEGGDAESDVYDEVVEVITPVLNASAEALAQAEADEDSFVELEHSLPQQALNVAAKALQAHPQVGEALPWESIISLLLFPHNWVRFGAARVLAMVFVARPAGKENSAKDLFGADALLDIARKSCILIGGSKTAEGETVVVDAKLADQLVKVLWNIAKYWIYEDKQAGNGAEGEEADAENNEDEDDEDEDDEGDNDVPASRPLSWLMSRLSFIARRLIVHRTSSNTILPGQPLPFVGPVTSILRCFAGMYEAISRAQARRYLPHILSPLYRILDENGDLASLASANGHSSMGGSNGVDDLKTLATQVRELVQAKVGSTAFSVAWERIRQSVRARRQDRREVRARLAVSDPKAWARRHDKRNVAKKESRKRKVHAFMDGKGKRPRRG